eukprot:SAG31_NODE_4259_length_3410_cov_2.021444_3_plen_185_part_00
MPMLIHHLARLPRNATPRGASAWLRWFLLLWHPRCLAEAAFRDARSFHSPRAAIGAHFLVVNLLPARFQPHRPQRLALALTSKKIIHTVIAAINTSGGGPLSQPRQPARWGSVGRVSSRGWRQYLCCRPGLETSATASFGSGPIHKSIDAAVHPCLDGRLGALRLHPPRPGSERNAVVTLEQRQ